MPRFIPIILALLLGLALGAAHAPITTRAQTPDPCAPTATATASPAPSATPTATPGSVYLPIIIYEDATATGWSRSGYSVTIADVTSPAPFSGAKAMRLTYGGWGGVRLTPTGPTSLSGTLSLALRGTGRMRVIVGSSQIGLLTATDAWAVHRLALPGGAVSMVELKNDLSSAATMYVDLLGVEGTGTPTPSPTGGPASPTLTPTAPTTVGALRVLPLGDSITEGVNGGYRDVLYTRLTTAGYTVDYVGPRYDQYANAPDKDHAGTPGWNSGNVLGAIDGYLSTYNPDVVLLMIGTNDLAWWVADATAPADAAARVGQIIDRVQATGARVILATTPPISDASVPPNGRSRAQLLRDYNAALRTLAAARGVTLVDVEAALTLSDLYDGVHPSEAAHDSKIAPLWAAALGA